MSPTTRAMSRTRPSGTTSNGHTSASGLAGVDDLDRTLRKGALTLERQRGAGFARRGQPRPGSEQQRQHDQSELVEHTEGAERLDRAGPSDEVDVAALVGVPKPFEQPRRVAVDD